MNNEQHIHLVTLPGTPYVYLANDANMAKWAKDRGTVAIENEITNLPDVKALSRDDFVLDVGAFIGDTAIVFAERAGQVVAFEAQWDAFAAAVINTRFYGNVHVYQYAVGNGERIQCQQDPIAGNLGTRTVGVVDSGEVFARKLDEMWLPGGPKVTFIKIDVEGFEASVIAGAMELLKRDKPTLLIEIYPELLARQGKNLGDIVNPLCAIGYTNITEAIGNHTEPRWDILCKPSSF